MEKSDKMVVGDFSVKIKRKKNLKKLYIKVIPPEGDVEVTAPISVEDEEIRLFLLKRMSEIIKVKSKMKKQERQSKREYVSGESHYVWGKLYRLQVIHQDGKSNIVKTPTKLIMTIPEDTSRESRERLMNNWYRKELVRVLESVIPSCEEKARIYGNEYKIKNMKTKWGSCNIDKKTIWINLQLAKKPIECLEYVLFHELIHFIERNHTDMFYSLMEKLYPTYRDVKNSLDTMPLESMKSGVENDNV